MGMVHTVRGPVGSADLGPTLAHEHVVVVDSEFARFYPELCWSEGRTAAVARAAAKLQAVKDVGIDTVVDCTAFLHGRDMEFLADVNAVVDIHLVVSTGIYTYDHLPHFLEFRAGEDPDLLTRMFLRDLRVGVGDSGVPAQMIKLAVDAAGITRNVARIVAASAAASVETGAPVTAHTHAASGNAREVQARLVAEGVDPARLVIGHAGDCGDLDVLRTLMDAGSVIACDRFGLRLPGTPDEEQRLAIIATLCAEGYADRIVLGHDAMLAHDWGPRLGATAPAWEPTRVSGVVLPGLVRLGVTDEHLHQMTDLNMARLLGYDDPGKERDPHVGPAA